MVMTTYVIGRLQKGVGELVARQVGCRRCAELRHYVTRVNSRNALCMMTAI